MSRPTVPRYWVYKAYDANRSVYEGATVCDDPTQLAYSLRQKGLQLISTHTVDRATYRKQLRLKRYRARLCRIGRLQHGSIAHTSCSVDQTGGDPVGSYMTKMHKIRHFVVLIYGYLIRPVALRIIEVFLRR